MNAIIILVIFIALIIAIGLNLPDTDGEVDNYKKIIAQEEKVDSFIEESTELVAKPKRKYKARNRKLEAKE